MKKTLTYYPFLGRNPYSKNQNKNHAKRERKGGATMKRCNRTWFLLLSSCPFPLPSPQPLSQFPLSSPPKL